MTNHLLLKSSEQAVKLTRKIMVKHIENLNHLCSSPCLSMLHDDIVQKNNLGQLHRDVIFVGAGFQVRNDGRTNAEWRNCESLK